MNEKEFVRIDCNDIDLARVIFQAYRQFGEKIPFDKLDEMVEERLAFPAIQRVTDKSMLETLTKHSPSSLYELKDSKFDAKDYFKKRYPWYNLETNEPPIQTWGSMSF